MQITEIFPWNDNFETGIDLIDRQHRKLVELLNVFTSHIAVESDSATLTRTFNELVLYTEYHFRAEESLWHRHLADDEWETKHRESHQHFIDTIEKLKSRDYRNQPDTVISETLSFLTNWLAFHILESDMCMAKFVKARESGKSIPDAKRQAQDEMNGSTKILLNAILRMYDTLTHRTIQMVSEISKRQKAETKLLLTRDAFDNTLDAICIINDKGLIVDANPSFLESAGIENRDYAIGKELLEIKSGFEYKGQSATIWKAVNDHGSWSGEFNTRTKAGDLETEWLKVSCIKNDEKQIINYVLVFSNVSHLLERQKSLERLASHDALTDLPNRLLLKDRLEHAIARAQRNREHLAVCLLDLDGFKAINDRLGHATGDSLLVEISTRLKKLVRSSDTIARLGGDEFVILICDLKEIAGSKILLERIVASVAEPIQTEEIAVKVTATIGVAVYPNDSQNPEDLLRIADEAMYQCKRNGKDSYQFSPAVTAAIASAAPTAS